MATSKFGFGKAAQMLPQQIKTSAILIMRASKQHFGENFDKEQFDGNKWPEVARRTAGNKFNKKRIVSGINTPSGKPFIVDQGSDYATRKILQGRTGRTRYKTIKADSSITNHGAVSTMTNPVPYSGWLNEGTPYMPKRPFMKQDSKLTIIQLTILKTETGKIWTVQP